MALAVPLVWGMGLVLAKGAIEQFPPILLMGFRFTLTAFLLVWFCTDPAEKTSSGCSAQPSSPALFNTA